MSATMYTKRMALSEEVKAFDEARSTDRRKWWPGDAALLVAAPLPARLPPGKPTAHASSFELGTCRQGTDGSTYRVVPGGGKVVSGKVLGAVQNVWERCPTAAATEQRKETTREPAQGPRQPPPPSQPAPPQPPPSQQRTCGTPGCSLPDGRKN